MVPGGYVVRQEAPLEQALAQAAYVSQQLGHPVAVTIPTLRGDRHESSTSAVPIRAIRASDPDPQGHARPH